MRLILFVLSAGAFFSLTTPPAYATDEWIKTSGNSPLGNPWGTATNWGENHAPASGELAIFDRATTTTIQVNVGPVTNPNILFDGAAGTYSLARAAFLVTNPGDSVVLGSTATSFQGSNLTEAVSGTFTDVGQTLTFENNSNSSTDALQIQGTVSGTGQLTLDGASTATTSTPVTVNSQTNNVAIPNNVVSSNISVPTVVKNGGGIWELTGTNTFTSLSVNNGTLAFSQAVGLGSSPISLGVNGGTAGTLESVGSGSVFVANNITVHGAGTERWVYGSAPTFAGTQTITDSSLTFAGTVPYSPVNTALTVSGKITGGTSATFDSNVNIVNGFVEFQNANNDYTGSTNILGGGQLSTFAGGLLPSGTVVNIGSTGETASQFETLNLGTSQTIGAINSLGGSYTQIANVGGTGARVIPGIGPFVTLTISGLNSDGQAVNSTFGGQIIDGIQPGFFANTALKVTGGVVTLSGTNNSYSGGTTLSGGTFLADSKTTSTTGQGAVAVNSGAILGGSGYIAPTIAGAGITVADGAVLKPGTAAIGNVAQNSLLFGLDSTQSHLLIFQTPTSGIAQMEFTLGAGTAPIVSTGLSFAGSSSFIGLSLDSQGEVQFNNNLVQIDDLTLGHLGGPSSNYLLFSGTQNSDYAGLTVGADGRIMAGLSLTGADAASYGGGALFLKNGDIFFTAPEPPAGRSVVIGVALLVVTYVARKEIDVSNARRR